MDKDLNLVVDNGNHLILSSNKSFLELCKIVNSENTLAYYGTNYQFFDFKSKNFWNLDLEKFKLPFGFLKKKNRIPDTKIIPATNNWQATLRRGATSPGPGA